MENVKRKKGRVSDYLSGLPFPIFMTVILLLSAGRMDYWQGWTFIAVYVFFVELTVFILSITNRKEEYKYDEDQGEKLEGWDKISFQLYNILGLVTLVVAGLDSGRFKWSQIDKPILFLIIGIALFSLGSIIIIWAKFSNDYFGTVFITQSTQAGQSIAVKGPYKIVRHPGYLGMMLTWIAMAFILGSLWSIIPITLILILFFVMTYMEDKRLITEIDEYKEYAKVVRHRVISGIW